MRNFARQHDESSSFRQFFGEATDYLPSSISVVSFIFDASDRGIIYIASDRPAEVLSIPGVAMLPLRDAYFFGRLIFRRTRHININSMYEICQNEFRLGAASPDHHFSSRGECDLDVKYRCIIARSREEYQVDSRFRFFRIIRSNVRTHLCDEKYDYIKICCFIFYFQLCSQTHLLYLIIIVV